MTPTNETLGPAGPVAVSTPTTRGRERSRRRLASNQPRSPHAFPAHTVGRRFAANTTTHGQVRVEEWPALEWG